MPKGYLPILYLVIFLSFIYYRMMAKKLINLDLNHATGEEKKFS